MKNIVDSFWRVFMFLDDIIYVMANSLGWLLQARWRTNSKDIRFPFFLVSCCLNWKENRKNLFPQTSGKRHSPEKVSQKFHSTR